MRDSKQQLETKIGNKRGKKRQQEREREGQTWPDNEKITSNNERQIETNSNK